MSSTNRGKQRNRDDFYSTPEWVVRALLPFLKIQDGDDVLDPCCGSGAILDIFAPPQLAIPSAKIDGPKVATWGIEIDAARATGASNNGHDVTTADALIASWPSCALTITNPPFSKAQEFVERALKAAKRGGTVAMLLRLAFLESAGRAAFHAKHPADVYVLANRPSFTENGKTDSCAYAWFVWGPCKRGSLRVLPDVDPARKRRIKDEPTGASLSPEIAEAPAQGGAIVVSGAACEMRPIPDAPGYFCDAEGVIYSTWRRARVGQKVAFSPDGEPKALAQCDRKTVDKKPTPYRSVMIARFIDGKRVRKPAYVHHLVALTFHGPRPDGLEVLHGEEGSSCNAARNLRYGTVDENGDERKIHRGDDWYRTRGMCPPRFKERHDIEREFVSPVEPAHAFADLVGGAE